MRFSLTEEQMAVRESCQRICTKECLPGVIERDRHDLSEGSG